MVTANEVQANKDIKRRAVLDRLSSTTLSEVGVASAASGLLPAPLDVAPFSSVAANATCGQRGAEEFCRDMPGKFDLPNLNSYFHRQIYYRRGVVCDVCGGPEGSSPRQHPASMAVDGDPDTWWQSPVITENGEYQHVGLVATLPGVS
ncbi:jg14065 [Pararge aegeria aegeria]|uniref:Jg14065 protein n=1 Tax=Pararge aegeria aegeria TaxID=348720 RepID=A0A8S4SRL8_9NEOP|nr:jg14065 [Pararge aegeria aegeria]